MDSKYGEDKRRHPTGLKVQNAWAILTYTRGVSQNRRVVREHVLLSAYLLAFDTCWGFRLGNIWPLTFPAKTARKQI
ncbi:hypothetical protein HBI82_129330 [Parastagonospora nodorum]|nr:hypothetical protein HBI82_129330 [Parastagonospora nodorum]